MFSFPCRTHTSIFYVHLYVYIFMCIYFYLSLTYMLYTSQTYDTYKCIDIWMYIHRIGKLIMDCYIRKITIISGNTHNRYYFYHRHHYCYRFQRYVTVIDFLFNCIDISSHGTNTWIFLFHSTLDRPYSYPTYFLEISQNSSYSNF